MNLRFQECLKKRKIIKFPKGKRLVQKELMSAEEDIENAKFGLSVGRYKWPTIQGYYAIYHTARALLFSRGYRERSHYCLYVALKELFVNSGLMSIGLAESFYHAMTLRENADYRSQYSRTGAIRILKNAEAFLINAKTILSENKLGQR